MSGHLRAHQAEAVEWLVTHPTGYLGDAPRVGKTRPLLAAARRLGLRPMVVCPAIVQTHWKREAEVMGVADPLVVSYDAIVRGGTDLMDKVLGAGDRPGCIITDEHHYLKHAGSRRTQLLLGSQGWMRRFPVRWPASGTPVPRHLGEMWTTLASLYPARLRETGFDTRRMFEEHFLHKRGQFVRGAWREKVIGQRNVEEFRALLEPIMLRRELDDLGLDVPPLDWQVLTVDASHHAFTDATTAERVATAAVEGKLAEIADDPHVARMRRRIGELKAPAVVELLRDRLAEGRGKVVVFAHHRDVLDILRKGLFPFGVAYVDGDTSPAKRDAAIDAFQRTATTRAFVGQTIACKEGLTLDAADTCYLVEPDWTGYVNEQAGKRVLNSVAGRRCTVQMVALAGTLDEGIVAQNRREVRMVNEVLA